MENQNSSKEQLHNDFIDLTVIKNPNCQVEFDVLAKPALLEKAHASAIKAVAKDSSIPGFRKGKAPNHLILKTFPKAVEEKWQQAVAEEAFQHCESLTKITLLNRNSRISFKMKKFSKDSAELSFSFESEPQIPDFDFSKINLKEDSKDSSKEETEEPSLENTLHKIRLFFAKWQEVKDRAVQLNDFVIVDVDIIDDEGKEKKAFSNTRLEVTEKNMAQWMRDIVIGMNPGEQKEGISRPDEDASEDDKKKFEEKKVRVSLKTIEEPVLPPVDDDLAKKVGVESAEIMKERLNYLLDKQAKEEVQKSLRDQVSDQLLEIFNFDLPKSLLEKEVSYRMQQIQNSPSERSRFEKLSDEEKLQERKNVETQAEKAVRLFYICKKIVMDNKLTFSADELTKDVKTPLDAMFVDRELMNPNKTEDQKAMIMSRLMLSTAQDFVISKLKETSSQSS